MTTDSELKDKGVSEENKTKKFDRSPNFPHISLPDALKRAMQLYESDDTTPVPIDLIHDRWGFKRLSGYLNKIVAALKAYGLIDVQGHRENRKISISNRAMRILENADDKEELIRISSLEPNVYREIWEAYKGGNLPKDDVLNRDLKLGEYFNFQFKNQPARELLIKNFNETIEFAHIDPADDNLGEEQEELEQDDVQRDKITNNDEMIREKKGSGKSKMDSSDSNTNYNFSIPLGSGETAEISIPYSITQTEFDIMLRLLEALKEAISTDTNEENSDSGKEEREEDIEF